MNWHNKVHISLFVRLSYHIPRFYSYLSVTGAIITILVEMLAVHVWYWWWFMVGVIVVAIWLSCDYRASVLWTKVSWRIRWCLVLVQCGLDLLLPPSYRKSSQKYFYFIFLIVWWSFTEKENWKDNIKCITEQSLIWFSLRN